MNHKKITIQRLALLILLAVSITASIELFIRAFARRTFVFYTIDSGIAAVEERMLRKSGVKPEFSSDREVNISRYVEETLLGPVSPNSMPLFPKETRLRSLLFREGVAYVDLSEEAAMAPAELVSIVNNRGVFTGFETLCQGIKRNFPYVKEVRFFITGKAAFAGQFR